MHLGDQSKTEQIGPLHDCADVFVTAPNVTASMIGLRGDCRCQDRRGLGLESAQKRYSLVVAVGTTVRGEQIRQASYRTLRDEKPPSEVSSRKVVSEERLLTAASHAATSPAGGRGAMRPGLS